MFRKCLLFVFLLFSAAMLSHAQQENISIDKSNVTVKVLLTEIGKATDYSFMYNNADVNENQKISFKVESQPVDEVLEMLAKQLSVTYQINGRQVILKKSESNTLITVTGKIVDVVNNEPIIGATVQYDQWDSERYRWKLFIKTSFQRLFYRLLYGIPDQDDPGKRQGPVYGISGRKFRVAG